MSIKLICKPELFNSRLSSHLGLNDCVEPGTTYFLCNDLSDVPTLVSSQDPLSLTALSGEGKVQILICKDRPEEETVSLPPVKKGKRPLETTKSVPIPGKALSLPTFLNSVNLQGANNFSQVTQKISSEIVCSVTSTPDPVVKMEQQVDHVTAASTSASQDITVPVYSFSPSALGSQAVLSVGSPNMVVAETSSKSNASLPCPALRHELKQTILQRRKDQGKADIDLLKEETDRQMATLDAKTQMTDEEKERYIKRRQLNNRASRRCREKRKLEDQYLKKEVQDQVEHKHNLMQLVTVLEGQKKFFRMWASGEKNISDDTINEMLKSVSESEAMIREFPIKLESKDGFSESVIISSSEYNSDDTRNGFELDSSQDTNDSADVRTGHYTGMEEVGAGSYSELRNVFGETSLTEQTGKTALKIEMSNKYEDSMSNPDSDLELIEIDKPLVIDID